VGAVSRRSLLGFIAVAAVLLAAAGVAGAVFIGDGRPDPPPSLRALDPESCRSLEGEEARSCFVQRFQTVLDGRDDPRPGVQAIADLAWDQGGFLLTNCHVVMHTVGRTYARDEGVTLATLMDHLPLSNDPGCSAGFAHGLVTGVAPDLDPSHPAESASVCEDAGTRWQRYSCVHGFGHAFMRLYADELKPALQLCTELGATAAPDCAQGAYHDYWLAVSGADGATLRRRPVTDPRRLCAGQPEAFVRACWYRGLLETRPDGFQTEAPRDLEDLCEDLDGIQREGCIAGAAVIGPPDPAAQLEICAGLAATADAASCVRGTKVQNLLKEPPGTYERLIEGCARFAAAARPACYRWLGKALTVVTDGRFARTGCPALEADAARQCAEGARTADEPLETFS
jgi:hypothetical protein